MIGLGSLTSLTGGGGLSTSSSATNGDFGSDQNYSIGNMTFGVTPKSQNNQQMIMLAGFAVVALLLWKK